MPSIIGATDAPDAHIQRQGIVPPAAQEDFQIKQSLITMIKNQRFYGLPNEDPLDHLDDFDRLCNLTRINGVSEDCFKLRLFPFSLGERAHQWEKALPSGSITSWAACKEAFLAKFFTHTRTARLRNDISNFYQKHEEPFYQAWERFKLSLSRCPHHGFHKGSLLTTLYRGALPTVKMSLDTASNGNFLTKDIDKGWELVENLASSEGNYAEDYVRGPSPDFAPNVPNHNEIKALNDKLDSLILTQKKAALSMHGAQPFQVQDGENTQFEEMFYTQAQGGYNNPHFTNVPPAPFSYHAPHLHQPYSSGPHQSAMHQQQQTPYTHDPDIKTLLQQLVQGLANSKLDVNTTSVSLDNKDDNTASQITALTNQVEALTFKIKCLESTTASTSNTTQIQDQWCATPNKLKASAHAITLRSGKQLPTREGQFSEKAVQNPKDYSNVNVVERTSLQHLPFTKGHAIYTEDIAVQKGGHLKQALGLFQAEESAPEATLESLTRSLDRVKSQPAEENTLGRHTRPLDRVKPPTLEEPPMSNLQLMLSCPYPQRFKKQILEEWGALIDRGVKYTERVMPLRDAYNLIPLDQHLLRKEMLKRIEAKELAAKELSQQEDLECNAIVEDDIIVKEKLEDPGSFTLPCSLNQTVSRNSLCDLEASVNIMPPSTTKNEKIDIHLGSDLVLKFGIDSVAKKPTIDGQLFSLKVMDHLFDPPFKEPPKKDNIQIAATKEEEVGNPNSEILSLEEVLDPGKKGIGTEGVEDAVGSRTEDITVNVKGSEVTRPPDSTPGSSQTPMCPKTPSLPSKLNIVKTSPYDYSSRTIKASKRAENELTSQLEEMKLHILDLKSNGNRSSPKKVIKELSAPGKSRAFNIATIASSLHYPPKLFHMKSPVPLYDPPPD